MTCNRDDLPSAPPPHEREQMVDMFWNSPATKADKRWQDEMNKATVSMIRRGYLIFTSPDMLTLTKEGYDYGESQ